MPAIDDILTHIVDPTLNAFAEKVLCELSAHGVVSDVRVDDDVPYAHPDGGRCAGYFVTYPNDVPRFGLSIDTTDTYWIGTLVHEYNHFRQWVDRLPLWSEVYCTSPGDRPRDVYDLMHEWSDGRRSLTREQLQTYTRMARDLELDCERRTVKTIVEHALPIDVPSYVQKANSYILSYALTPVFGSAYVRTPYVLQEVWSKMPDTFDVDYDVEWMRHVELYWHECYDPKLGGT